MLQVHYDPKRQYRFVIYARMSSQAQNERSPESQVAEIEDRLRRAGYPWIQVRTYIDRAISGRYDRKRPEYQRMLRDIRSGLVKVDIVVVDTYDRFSRSRRGGEFRAKLERQGVLVVTANNSFADPTTVAGRVMNAFEEERAREEGRVKGHQVRRGKADAIRQKQWPGGPVPLGMRLRPVLKNIGGLETISHNVLEPDPDKRWIVEDMYRLADEKGFGATRVAAVMNADPRVVDLVGHLSGATVAEILKRRVYAGEFVWNKQTGDIVDDVRVLHDVPEADWLRVPEYCEAIIDDDRWQRVNNLRKQRNRRKVDAETRKPGIAGLCAPGIALRYPLSGLLICAECGRAMTASSGLPYTDKDGKQRRYVYYGCSGHKHGKTCVNDRFVPEQWIRDETFRIVREGLDLDNCDAESVAVQEVIRLVQEAFSRQRADQPNRLPGLQATKTTLEGQLQGWIMSLANSQLTPTGRDALIAKMNEVESQLTRLVTEIDSFAASERIEAEVLNAEVIMARLQNLSEVMLGANPSATSLLLAQHIQGIHCFRDGRCEVRLCKLGALAGDFDFLPIEMDHTELPRTAEDGTVSFEPRRRTKRDARAAMHDDDVLDAANEFAVDPHRFAELGPEWFVSHVLSIPAPTSWARRNSIAVAAYRQEHQSSMSELASHFNVSIPTIRQALHEGERAGGGKLTGKLSTRPNQRNWARLNAAKVADFMRLAGATIKSATIHFAKSEPTIKKAIRYANS
ncbi:recombinase family protein [Anatilimnocola sp. NA78]|uniref:recombinase family protein n=1 Tax=Anatilimnocola sp. NA78 TaxID=3415683 RepID=UPI003CE58669